MPFKLNSLPSFGRPLLETERATVGRDAPPRVRPFLSLRGEHVETPLVNLPEIAVITGVRTVMIKDEGLRLGQGSFKALGGAYAVMVLFKRHLERQLARKVDVAELLSPAARDLARGFTVCCATDGNHGKSVANGARLLGCRSVIFIHEGVSEARAEAIGADEIIRVEGTYDMSVEEAKRVASERGWLLVADTGWEGYEEIPGLVAQGYTILAEEAARQFATATGQGPTHVFLQAGVGGFASSIAGFLADSGSEKPVVAIVEPARAACLLASAEAGGLTTIEAGEPTLMAMLECYTPSLPAWKILEKLADAFMSVDEEEAEGSMRRLANRPDGRVVAGESGAAGLAGLLRAAADRDMRQSLRLGPDSRVLLINTETATDPASYLRIVGRTPAEVMAASEPVTG